MGVELPEGDAHPLRVAYGDPRHSLGDVEATEHVAHGIRRAGVELEQLVGSAAGDVETRGARAKGGGSREQALLDEAPRGDREDMRREAPLRIEIQPNGDR